jgi:ParB family chromosome partitioning protein
MTSSKPKLVLSRSQDIAFNKLILSQSNVRRVKAGQSIEDLAEDIAHRGLLQSLNVRPVLDGNGAATEMFEVPAGSRRYRALELLVKQKRMAKTTPVPCVVREGTETSAEEDSLAENTFRLNLHPLDEFRTIQTLRAQGLGDDTIATHLRTTTAIVKQRARLMAVSEKLLAIYGNDGMTLEQLMAFTVSDDHARQEQVWQSISEDVYVDDPQSIRGLLTEDAVEASDKRVRFVGIDAYQAAGGAVMRDLFDEDDGGWLQDPALLDRLVTDKLKAVAETIGSEGWKWIAVALTFPYGHNAGMRRLAGTVVELTEEEHASRDALRAELGQLEEKYAQAEEYPDEVDQRAGEIEAVLEAFENRPVIYDPAEIGRAGAFISLTSEGGLRIERGYVRRDDETPAEPQQDEPVGGDDAPTSQPEAVSARAVITIGGAPADDDEQDDEGIKPLPDRLLSELTAHRTLALQDAVANHPHVAMTALLYKLCLDCFYRSGSGSCLEASVSQIYMPIQAADLKDSASALAIGERQDVLRTELPEQESALWEFLAALADERRMALLAHCVSLGVTALHERADRPGGSGPSRPLVERRLVQANRLARAVDLDMAEAGWRPTVENYLGRVTKPRILEAVREARGEQSAQLIDHLKKAEMAKEAERLLEGTGWLPEPLRLAEPVVGNTDDDAAVEALPDFLADDVQQVAAE